MGSIFRNAPTEYAANAFAQEHIAPLLPPDRNESKSWKERQFGDHDDSSTDDDVSSRGSHDNRGPSGEHAWRAMSTLEYAKMVAVYVASAAGAAASLTSALYSPQILVLVSGGVNVLITVPSVWWKEWKLSLIPAFRRKVNDLRNDAQHLKREIHYLTEESKYLSLEVDRLQQETSEIRNVVERNGDNVDELVALVKENQTILTGMKNNLRKLVAQDVVRQVMQSDLNNDGHFNEREAAILACRMQMSLKSYDIILDVDKFQKAIGKRPSIVRVLKTVKALMPAEEQPEDATTTSTSSDDTDSSSSSSSSASFSPKIKRRSRKSNSKWIDETYDMFYMAVDQEVKKGDAETLKLKRKFERRSGNHGDAMVLSLSDYNNSGLSAMREDLLASLSKDYEEGMKRRFGSGVLGTGISSRDLRIICESDDSS